MADSGVVVTVDVDDAERARIEAIAPDGVVASAVDEVGRRVADEAPVAVVLAAGRVAATAIDAVERVRERDPDVAIVVTADGDESLAADAVAAGADRYVPRERGPDALGEAVEAAVAIGRRRRDRGLESEILGELLRRAPLEIAAKDTERRHVRSTKTVLRPEVVGKRGGEFLDDERSAVIEREDEKLLASEEPIEEALSRYEVDATGVDDHDAGWIRSWKYPWYDDGDLRGLIGFTQDVTGVMQTQEELRRKNDLLSKFASVVTHDLRNPLNVAEGNLELVRRDPDEEYFDAIERSLTRMNDIIDDLVRLTRESDDGEETAVTLAKAARSAWETVDTADASLDVDVGDAVIRADEGPLQQLFENLFRNSVEHAGDDVTVTVGLVDGGFVVADDGPGLPKNVAASLNEGDFSTNGLGLSIVRTIADRHDWTLRAGAGGSGGARFAFTNCRIVNNTGTDAVDRRPVALEHGTAVGEFAAGEHAVDDGTWTVTGRGRNFWRQVNEFYFAYGLVVGDADLVGRLADFSANVGKSKAGIVVRAGLDATAAHGFIGLTPEHGIETLWQLEEGAGTQSRLFDDDATVPQRLRLKREGDTVTVFTAEHGTHWTPVDEQELLLGDDAYYGLAVCSHAEQETATATFEDVDLAGVTWE